MLRNRLRCLLSHNYIYCNRYDLGYDPRERTRDMDWNGHYITQTYDGGEPLQQALQSLTFSGLPSRKRALGDSPQWRILESGSGPLHYTTRRLFSPLRHRHGLTLLAVSASIRALEHAIRPEHSAGACVAILGRAQPHQGDRITKSLSPRMVPRRRSSISICVLRRRRRILPRRRRTLRPVSPREWFDIRVLLQDIVDNLRCSGRV